MDIGSVELRATRRCSVCWSYEERQLEEEARRLQEEARRLQEDEARRIQQVAREPKKRSGGELEEERELVRT
jgi:hypothetical protein